MPVPVIGVDTVDPPGVEDPVKRIEDTPDVEGRGEDAEDTGFVRRLIGVLGDTGEDPFPKKEKK